MATNTNHERQKIVLAALLHDIGKFWQRADEKMKDSSNLEKEWYEKYQWLVPGNKYDRPGYQHAFWTFAFIIKHKEVFKKAGINENEIENFALLAANHHRPNNEIQGIISLGDKWASKNERKFADYAKTQDEDIDHIYWGRDAYKKIPLHSIFDLICREGTLREEEKSFYDFLKLKVEGDHISIFPTKRKIDPAISRQEDYKKLWDEFEEEFSRLPNKVNSFEQLLVSLMAILQKYTWCIPSSTMDMPYANLYEHLKITAAMSIAIYDFYVNDNTGMTFENVPNYGKQLFLTDDARDVLLLVSVDMSGIQKFIYNISGSGAAKSLKGRSYFLQLLMDSVLNYILENTGMFKTNIIYASGGMAYLILPNTDEIKEKLNQIRQVLEEKFFEAFETRLYAAIGWTSFRYQIKYKMDEIGWDLKLYSDDKDFEGDITLGNLWQQASLQSSKYKLKKFQSLLGKNFDRFFEPEKITGNEKMCSVTGVFLKPRQYENISDDGEEELLVSKDVYKQIQLGKALSKANTISEYSTADEPEKLKFINPANLNTTFSLNPEPEYIKEDMILYKYNDTDLEREHGFKFLGGNKQPLKIEEGKEVTKSFEEMCEFINKKGEKEFTKLGVLKMDVDDLGKIFIKGLDEKDKSFSAYATLSFYLEAFFSGYINDIRNSDIFKDNVQIIYSGGDDVFAVGRWDKIIEFADEINDSFHKFTEREDITLSAGIAIVGRKYPVAKAAELADEAEKASKKYNRNGKEKNAITFFGETVSWDDEFPFVKEIKDQFMKFMDKEKPDISLGFLHKIQGYKIFKDQKQKEGAKDFSYKWHSAYMISRILGGKKDDKKEMKEFLKDIQKNLMHNKQYGSDRYLDLIALAARWTEYLLKLKK